ncbi:unnamed protein product, partial [Brassica oleracea]
LIFSLSFSSFSSRSRLHASSSPLSSLIISSISLLLISSMKKRQSKHQQSLWMNSCVEPTIDDYQKTQHEDIAYYRHCSVKLLNRVGLKTWVLHGCVHNVSDGRRWRAWRSGGGTWMTRQKILMAEEAEKLHGGGGRGQDKAWSRRVGGVR